MQVSIDDFWRLAAASELLSPSQCQELQAAFAGLKGAAQRANARSLAEWLVSAGRLTQYQAAVLLSGRPGPFAFGPFVVTERVERGRLARLYRATHERGPHVLLVFLSQLTDDAGAHQRLVEMARAAAAVKNPHVSRTLRAVRHRSQTMIVVEGLEGESLAERGRREKISQRAACQYGFQAALGLVAMHAEDLAHGSVCPHNVWIDVAGTGKLLQFPLVSTAAHLKRRESPLVDYLAPELADEGQRPAPLTDIYGLGCTLYELVAGHPPFSGGTSEQKIARHRDEFPPRLDQLDPQVPEELADLVADMLAKDPLLRCPSAAHVAHLLAAFSTDGKQSGGHPPKLEPGALAPGYGPWTAPDWQPPPRTIREEAAPAAQDSGVRPEAIVVTRESVGPANVRSRQRLSKTALAGIAAGLVVVALGVLGAVVANRSERMSQPIPARAGATAEATGPPPAETSRGVDAESGSTASQSPTVNLVDDDGRTLWISPTTGEPLDPAYLPNGSQLVLALRPAELAGSPEGTRLLDALGPGGQWARQQLRRILGVEPADIEQLLIGVVPDDALQPRFGFVMRLAGEVPQDSLLSAWGKPAPAMHRGKRYFQGGGRAYLFPEAGQGRVVAIAPAEMMEPIIESAGSPLLRSGVERLLARSDDRRHVTLLLTPSYLLTDGRSLLAGHLGPLHGPLEKFLDDRIEAVLFSAHLGEALFVEFRAVAPVDLPPPELLQGLQSRWQAVPERVEGHVASLEPQPYGRLVINRFPRMLQLARDLTRGAVEDGQVVLRTYLPASAAHNLAMGAELTLLESVGVSRAAAAGPPQKPPGSAADRLRKKVALSFAREPLDRALEMLAGELGLEIAILGSDLQLEGITRNQSLVNVDERDQPGEAILRKLLKLANPHGKLAYVIKPNEVGEETVFITTRAAAKKRGETLPPAFVGAGESVKKSE